MPTDRARYKGVHTTLRRQWAAKVRLGGVVCWRCGKPITRTEPWDLGHADGSSTIYAGPEHRACNRRAAARLTNSRKSAQRLPTSRDW